ncbi:chemotaxis motB protein, OmpA family [Elysia marginata]|uniref:Chemotaxis motB protein, OmpA family n=1 Tax=Elysia marginata TaxID=1093978 RepID=A0AAV4GG04_9GAST|nr:chemotaxis motB protein, OmpA family [Elysia marginata]
MKTKADEAEMSLQNMKEENVALTAKLDAMNQQAEILKSNNNVLMNNVGDLTLLTKKGAENLGMSLESLREKDLTIKSLQEAVNKKDSLTLTLITNLKSSLDDINDPDININVEKGVVYISISEKVMFRSGSHRISGRAKVVLGKVAKILKDKKDYELIVEGHTDNVPINLPGVTDNWDLSALRATSVARVLQKDFSIDPSRISAAGRSQYVPLAENTTAKGRELNRRIKIILIPKLDQFFDLVEQSLGQSAQ